jgi:hypothetical protein
VGANGVVGLPPRFDLLLFVDEDQKAKAERDPVAPAKRADEALRKAATLHGNFKSTC